MRATGAVLVFCRVRKATSPVSQHSRRSRPVQAIRRVRAPVKSESRFGRAGGFGRSCEAVGVRVEVELNVLCSVRYCGSQQVRTSGRIGEEFACWE